MYSCRTIGFAALALLLLAGLVPVAGSAASPGAAKPQAQPDVRSHAFCILDESDSSVLAARRERVPVPIASITKLMTALVVLEAGQPIGETLTITSDDVRGTAGGGSRLAPGARLSRGYLLHVALMTALVVLEAGQPIDETLTITSDDVHGTAGGGSRLAPGARLSRGDLLHLALMSSENRAAHALCRQYPRGMPACVRAMNEKAAGLGMTTARFVEPTGLSSRNVASPEDLAKLVLAAAGNPTIRDYSTDPAHTVYVNRRPVEVRNTNALVENPAWHVNVQKTGYISEAGRCLVMQTSIDGRQVVIVLLNSWGKLTGSWRAVV